MDTNILSQFVKKQELGTKKHFDLKCGDRGRDRMHCRALVDLACAAWTADKNGFTAFCHEFGEYTPHQFMMAGTGRPLKSRKSGKKDGCQAMADEIANAALTELAAYMGVERPDVRYNNCQLGLVAEMKTAAPATVAKKHKKAQ
jgi:hypothetical protein